jgi:phage protein D
MVSDWSVTEVGRGGSKSVKCAYLDRATGKRHYVTAGSGTPCLRDKRLYATPAEAKAAANAALGDLVRGKRTADFEGEGNPALFAEAVVTLKGFDPDCDGDFPAKSVTHSFSSGGYTTRVSLEMQGGSEPEEGDGTDLSGEIG